MPPAEDSFTPDTSKSDATGSAKLKLGSAKFESVNSTATSSSSVDVHQILRENLDHANRAGLNDLAPVPARPSRRRRDYWLVMAGGNLAFGFIAASVGPTKPIVFVSALAGMVLLSGGLTWAMWFVMDDY